MWGDLEGHWFCQHDSSMKTPIVGQQSRTVDLNLVSFWKSRSVLSLKFHFISGVQHFKINCSFNITKNTSTWTIQWMIFCPSFSLKWPILEWENMNCVGIWEKWQKMKTLLKNAKLDKCWTSFLYCNHNFGPLCLQTAL